MASWVDIANLALTHLGASPITSLEDASNEARSVNRVWELVRDAVLREHPWNCALARAALAADAAPPAFGFGHAYTLPADPYCLRVLGIGERTEPWVVEGRTLLTDRAPPLPLRYIARLGDPELFDAALTAAMAARLAHAIAPEITQSAEKEARMWELWERLSRNARSLDGMEGARQDRRSSFLEARY